MKRFFLLFVVLLSLSVNTEANQHRNKTEKKAKPIIVDADRALRKLVEGNRRFATHHMLHPDETVQRRVNLALKGQHPFAIVLSCSDSRVPPEIVFDEGLGDLFVIRIVGNIVDDAVIGSIEYAAEHLGVKLLVVLGHEKCGAVQAAIENQREAHLANLVEAIRPAVEKVRSQWPESTSHKDSPGFTEKVVRTNVFNVVSNLQNSEPILSKLVREKELKIVGGYYHLASGKVEFLP